MFMWGVGILVVGTVRAATARDGDEARRSDPAADGTTAGRVSDGGSPAAVDRVGRGAGEVRGVACIIAPTGQRSSGGRVVRQPPAGRP